LADPLLLHAPSTASAATIASAALGRRIARG
jgi:hypothetical protein